MSEPNPILKKPPGFKDPNKPVIPPPPLSQKPGIPRSQIPPSFHPKPKNRNCCRCCCCFFCTLFILIILLLGVSGSLFYFWFNPKLPIFRLESMKTPLFNVSVTPDGTFLDALTEVTFEASNPNTNIDFYYDQTEVRMTVEEDVDLGSATIPKFTQLRKNTTMLKFETKVKHSLIDDDAGLDMKRRIRSRDLEVDVEVRTKVGIGLENVKLGMMGVKVVCEKVTLKQVGGGATPKCYIVLFNLINLH